MKAKSDMLTPMNFINPLDDIDSCRPKLAEPCVMVIFGATGDLTGRKLLPALYNLAKDDQLPTHFACVGFARRDKDNQIFRAEMKEAVSNFSRTQPLDEQLWSTFQEQIFYHQSEFHDDEGYERLRLALLDIDRKFGTKGNRVFYLSTQPSFFPLIVEKLAAHQLIYDPNDNSKWSRVIVEKPFGNDLQSAIKLQDELTKFLDENQLYRIDHYLGKETVQNLLILRTTNPIFEAIWNHKHIDHMQITVSEEIGIGTRGQFWEEAGMLRDIVQNHMMQLLALVAMDPPADLHSATIHAEKIKVMKRLRPLPADQIDNFAVRGQYGAGFINGAPVIGYRNENRVSPTSNVETYAALELRLDHPRWEGVPFFLRAGKRLPKRITEIAIYFKESSNLIYQSKRSPDPNILVIRIQPGEGISLKTNCKVPGINQMIQPVTMDFRYSSYFGLTSPEAYERLLCDCMIGDSTLFARADEVLASWKLITPVLEHWQATPITFPNYASGTWGPTAADQMLTRQNYRWRLL